MNDAYIYDAVRTPRGRGRDNGALRTVTPVSLAAQTLFALRSRNHLVPETIDDVGFGVVMPLGEQGADLTRTALLAAGYGDTVPGYQINRYCVSALDTINMAAAGIMAGQIDAAIGGGVESMSRVAIGSDGGAIYADPSITAQHIYMPNGVAADLIASLEGYSRDELDAYSAQSQQRAARAQSQGHFNKSLITVRGPDESIALAQDEAVRAGTTAEGLAALKPAFASIGHAGFNAIALQRYPHLERIKHVHTSGSSSAIVDGAAAVLLGSKAFGEQAGIRPRARIRAFASIGSEPLMNLGGPVPVTRKLLARSGIAINDIDLFEVNEAFAVVPLHYARTFDIPQDKLNVNGGAIALGHPLGATGAILIGTVLDELERSDRNLGLVVLCAAAGQATATIIERI